MNICYIGLGSNQKSPERQLRLAIRALRSLDYTSITKVSSFYKTKAWGMQKQQSFCNAVIEMITVLTPTQLLNACQRIEKEQGRVRKRRWGPRVIDIDLLLYGERNINSPRLIIPHPRMLERDFVLLPLREIGLRAETKLLCTSEARKGHWIASPSAHKALLRGTI